MAKGIAPTPVLGENMIKSEGLPLALFLTAAFISFCFSIALWFFVNKDYGVFVGLWVPSILSLGSLMRARR